MSSFTKEEKHLLDRYSEDLHLFIKALITEGREFTAEDLIRLWQANQHPPADDNTEFVSPPKNKRLESRANKSDKPKKSNKDRARLKKSLDSSSALAGQEIFTSTQYNSVFPAVTAPKQHHGQLPHLQQEDDLFSPHVRQPQQLLQPNSLLQHTQHPHRQKEHTQT